MADNMGKVTRFPLPRYEAQGAQDNAYDREGCVCSECRRQRRRSGDRAESSVIARRITVACLAVAALFGVLYGFGETLGGLW